MIVSKRKVVRDTLIYTLLPKISVFANLLILPIISPYLTLTDYGLYGLIIAYLSIFQIVITLGQNVVLQNSFFEYGKNYKKIWRRSFGLMIMAGIVSALIFSIVVSLSLSSQMGQDSFIVCLLISLYLIFSPIETIAVNYFVLHEKPLPYALCLSIVGVISVLLNLYTIRLLELGYIGWVIILPVSTIIMYVFYFKRFFLIEKLYPIFSLKKSFVSSSLKVGGPLVPHQMSLYILGASDRLLLEYASIPTVQIGFYSQGYNLASYGNVLINGVFQSLSRRLQEGFRGNGSSHRIFIRKMMISIPVVISSILSIVALWMKEIFLFLFRKPELQNAYPVTIVVICAYMFWPVYTFFTYPLGIQKKTFSISKISISAAGINFVGNIILIPFWGIWATLGVTYVSYMVFAIAGLFNRKNCAFLSKYINVKKFCFGMLFINIFLFLLSYYFMEYDCKVKLVITFLLIVFVSLGYKKYFRNRDWKAI